MFIFLMHFLESLQEHIADLAVSPECTENWRESVFSSRTVVPVL